MKTLIDLGGAVVGVLFIALVIGGWTFIAAAGGYSACLNSM